MGLFSGVRDSILPGQGGDFVECAEAFRTYPDDWTEEDVDHYIDFLEEARVAARAGLEGSGVVVVEDKTD